MTLRHLWLVLLLACTGCAGVPDKKVAVKPEWTESSLPVFLTSSLSRESVNLAKNEIVLKGAVFCKAAMFSLSRIAPAIINAGLNGIDEIWTTDICGEQKWLVVPEGQAQAVPR